MVAFENSLNLTLIYSKGSLLNKMNYVALKQDCFWPIYLFRLLKLSWKYVLN